MRLMLEGASVSWSEAPQVSPFTNEVDELQPTPQVVLTPTDNSGIGNLAQDTELFFWGELLPTLPVLPLQNTA
jgi:hypothetical protein